MGKRPLRSEKKFEIVDGEYRTFHTFYKNGKRATLGVPKEHCPDQRVWAGENGKEVGRVSHSEAQRLMNALAGESGLKQVAGGAGKPALLGSGEASCPSCGATLRKRNGRRGPFLGCSNYPDCRYTRDA
jgi:hypothetical protein